MLSNIEIQKMKERTELLMITQNRSQYAISKAIVPRGTMPGLMSKWLHTPYNISLKHAILLTETFDISIDYLFAGIGSDRKRATLYDSDFSLDEKEVLSAFQTMSVKQQDSLLKMLRSMIPTNAFCSARFLDSEQEQIDKNMDELLSFFTRKLKTYIKDKKITQREMAKKTGIHVTALTRIISGERQFSLANFLLICDFLEVYPTDMLSYYCEPEKISGLSEAVSDCIVYYRMLDKKKKGQVLALIKYQQGAYH